MNERREISIEIDGRRIEAAWFGPRTDSALVLLHGGLSCLALWRDFPQKLAARTGFGVLAVSRPGYGMSDPVPLPRPLSYMHDEAFELLPHLLDQARIKKTILVGHSDGGSVAAIYAGGRQDFRVRGLALLAPHFFAEDITIRSIQAAKAAYDHGDLRRRLSFYQGDNVDVAFRGWCDAWLDPGFRDWRIDDYVAHIRVPILIVQGLDDEYGTLAQVQLAETDAYCPVETVILNQCKHSPHIDQPAATLDAIADFVHRVFVMHEGLTPRRLGTHAF